MCEHKVGWKYEQEEFERYVNSDGAAIAKIQLKWETVEERTASLLAYYWHDFDRWNNLASRYGYKTEFVACLSQAETWLGQAKKSQHNYFNCGNNDRGDTVSHWSLEKSFTDLSRSCLDGTYLWWKQTLSHLSPNHKRSSCYNNGDDPLCKYVYASSRENRLNNVGNCLSNIHNRQITPEYEFRK